MNASTHHQLDRIETLVEQIESCCKQLEKEVSRIHLYSGILEHVPTIQADECPQYTELPYVSCGAAQEKNE